jgi:hypothetical protein
MDAKSNMADDVSSLFSKERAYKTLSELNRKCGLICDFNELNSFSTATFSNCNTSFFALFKRNQSSESFKSVVPMRKNEKMKNNAVLE